MNNSGLSQNFHNFFPWVSVKSIIFSLIIRLNTILFSLSSFRILTFFSGSQSISTKLEMYKFSWCGCYTKLSNSILFLHTIVIKKVYKLQSIHSLTQRWLHFKICYINAKSCNANPSYQKNLYMDELNEHEWTLHVK